MHRVSQQHTDLILKTELMQGRGWDLHENSPHDFQQPSTIGQYGDIQWLENSHDFIMGALVHINPVQANTLGDFDMCSHCMGLIATIGNEAVRTYHLRNCSFVKLAKVNSSLPSAGYMCQWKGSALFQIMACCLFGATLLSKPMLGYCQLYHQEQTSVKIQSKYTPFRSRKCIWKYRLRNGAHFFRGRWVKLMMGKELTISDIQKQLSDDMLTMLR